MLFYICLILFKKAFLSLSLCVFSLNTSDETAHNGTATSTPPSLGWVAAPVLVTMAAVVAISVGCGIWSYWLYKTGYRRYWGRVQNEHLVAVGSGGPSSGSQDTQTRESSEELEDIDDSDRRGLFHFDV